MPERARSIRRTLDEMVAVRGGSAARAGAVVAFAGVAAGSVISLAIIWLGETTSSSEFQIYDIGPTLMLAGIGLVLVAVGITKYAAHRRQLRDMGEALQERINSARRGLDYVELPYGSMARLEDSPWGPVVAGTHHPSSQGNDPEFVERGVDHPIHWRVGNLPTEVLEAVSNWLHDDGEFLAAALVSAYIADREQFGVLEQRARNVLDRALQVG